MIGVSFECKQDDSRGGKALDGAGHQKNQPMLRGLELPALPPSCRERIGTGDGVHSSVANDLIKHAYGIKAPLKLWNY